MHLQQTGNLNTSMRFILLLSCQLCSCFLVVLFIWGFISNILYAYVVLQYILHVHKSSSSCQFNHSRRVQILQLLLMLFSPLRCCCISLRGKHTYSHTAWKLEGSEHERLTYGLTASVLQGTVRRTIL